MSKAMFVKTQIKVSNGKTYNAFICNSDRDGCGNYFFAQDKAKHRHSCFKTIAVKKRTCKCGIEYSYSPGEGHICI